MLLLLLLLLGLAHAEALPTGMDAVSSGDRARWAGDRVAAREHYRQAAAIGDPEAVAMARLRLLGSSGNVGAIVHGPRIDEALAQVEGAWGWLAVADFHLLAPPPIGGDLGAAADAAEHALALLPGPAAARLWLATGDGSWLAALEVAPDRDGLGDALVAHDGSLPAGPGTWTLGIGVAAAPGAGFGGGLVFLHPDLAARGWRLDLHAAGTTRGTFDLGIAARTAVWAGLYGHGGARLGRTDADLYDDEGLADPFVQWHASARLGPGWRWRDLSVWAGAVVRWDRVPWWVVASSRCYDIYDLDADLAVSCDQSPYAGHGGFLGAAWDTSSGWGGTRRGYRLSVGLDGVLPVLADYDHLVWRAEARGYLGVLRGVLAGRILWSQSLSAEPALFRLPSAGGAEVHRGAWAGRYRAEWILAVDVEQRWMVHGPFEAVVFLSPALVAATAPDTMPGVHPAGGVGVRFLFPPEELNVIRLDVAVSDSGWGVYAGWGETF